MSSAPRSAWLGVVVAVVFAGPLGAAGPVAPHGRGGAVASAAPAATAAGLEVLEAGGNAADAAVATAVALAVVHPIAGNLGGGGFAVVRVGAEVAALDFRETAPSAASRDMFLDARGRPDPERSLVGPLAAGVPGSAAGLHELHRRFGRLPWARVVAPAVRLAEGGFVVTERLAAELAGEAGLLARFPETAAVWLPGGSPPAAGCAMQLPELGATLRAYAAQGPAAIMTGPAAAAVEAASARHGGVLAARDLEGYAPAWRDPVRFEAFGFQVASMPLPSSGGVILGQTLGLADRLGYAQQPRSGADRAHLLAETWRRAFADRTLLGDPATTRAETSDLLAPAWLDRRAAEVDGARATPSARVLPWPARPTAEAAATTHLAVVDGDGNAVSLTTTLNGGFGCGLLVPGLGFLLNNEMDDFAAAPGVPNLYGLVQGEANEVGPGKRMLSSMAPAVAWREGEVLAVGSPGGSRIPTAVAQVVLNLLVDGDPLQRAVDRPRLHHQWLPDLLRAEEDALSPETAAELERRGHRMERVGRLGEVCAVRWLGGGAVEAAADPRGPGSAGVLLPAPGSEPPGTCPPEAARERGGGSSPVVEGPSATFSAGHCAVDRTLPHRSLSGVVGGPHPRGSQR